MVDRTPLLLIDTARLLTGTLTELGTAGDSRLRLGTANSLYLIVDYTRHAGSVTGVPIVKVEAHPGQGSDGSATATTAQIAAFTAATFMPCPVLDSSTFSSGRMDAFPFYARLYPTASGTTRYAIGPIDVSHGNFARVLAADVDAANPGTATFYWRGLVT